MWFNHPMGNILPKSVKIRHTVIGETLWWCIYPSWHKIRRPHCFHNGALIWDLAATYSSTRGGAVPSALRGLTSLFGMGRGEHPCSNRHWPFMATAIILWHTGKLHACARISSGRRLLDTIPPALRQAGRTSTWKTFGWLVSLGFDVTIFTPVTYQRGHLPRPL